MKRIPSALVLIVLLSVMAIPATSFSQYAPKYLHPTQKLLNKTYHFPAGLKDVHLCTLASQVGLNLKYNFDVGQELQLNTKSQHLSGQDILNLIDATDEYRTVIREWEVLVVSDVDDKRIQELTSAAMRLQDTKHATAIEQLLKLSHPSIYPSLFWVMKHDKLKTSRQVSRALLTKHSAMMNYSPSFENAVAGFKRSFQNEEARYLSMAYNLPEPILPQVDPATWLGANRSTHLEERVSLAKLTLADLKRKYEHAPPSPSFGELCGTGYVHTYNHNDYANMIGDLRTDEAYAFLNDQADKLAREPSAANHRKLAELATVLAKRDNDDALNIANIIIEQQKLDHPSRSMNTPAGILSINSTAGMLKVFAATGQEKYVPVFLAFCNSADGEVRRAAFTVLHAQKTPGLFELGLQGLNRIEEHAASLKDAEAKQAVEQSRYHAAFILSLFQTDEAQQHFLNRLNQPEHSLEAAGYLLTRIPDQSVPTLKKLLVVDGVPLKADLRLELLKRNDPATITEVLQRMETRYAALVDNFLRTHQNGWNYSTFNGWLCYIDPDIEMLRSLPQPVARGIELMQAGNTPLERKTGAIMVYTASRVLITEQIAKSLAEFKDDPELIVNKIANAILSGRQK